MVTRELEKRPDPAYALVRVVELARNGIDHVQYVGRVLQDANNLGYAPHDLCQCLATLRTEDFHHAERYPNDRYWRDVYLLPSFVSPGGHRDNLYLKFMLKQSCLVVVLCSFHRDR